jgi:hypothetical protein
MESAQEIGVRGHTGFYFPTPMVHSCKPEIADFRPLGWAWASGITL